jgi:hypothetical protein
MPTQKPSLSALSTLAIAMAALASTACTASLSATPAYPGVSYDYPVVAVATPTVRVYDRAPVVYQSSTTYSVGAGWYYPAGPRVHSPDPYRRHGQPAYTRREPDRRRHGDARHETHRSRYD